MTTLDLKLTWQLSPPLTAKLPRQLEIAVSLIAHVSSWRSRRIADTFLLRLSHTQLPRPPFPFSFSLQSSRFCIRGPAFSPPFQVPHLADCNFFFCTIKNRTSIRAWSIFIPHVPKRHSYSWHCWETEGSCNFRVRFPPLYICLGSLPSPLTSSSAPQTALASLTSYQSPFHYV